MLIYIFIHSPSICTRSASAASALLTCAQHLSTLKWTETAQKTFQISRTPCHLDMTDCLSAPIRGFVSNSCRFRPSQSSRLSARTMWAEVSSHMQPVLWLALVRAERSLTKAPHLQQDSHLLPSGQLPALNNSWETVAIESDVKSPRCTRMRVKWNGHQDRLGKCSSFWSYFRNQIDPQINGDKFKTAQCA